MCRIGYALKLLIQLLHIMKLVIYYLMMGQLSHSYWEQMSSIFVIIKIMQVPMVIQQPKSPDLS